MPRDIPIIFSGPMVKALLDGRKTMTRRLAWRAAVTVADDAPSKLLPKGWKILAGVGAGRLEAQAPTPWQKVEPGDRLWVRENFSKYDYRDGCWYWADGREAAYDSERPRPSIHMPRWASRITLVVTATKIERLHEISHADVLAEGTQPEWIKRQTEFFHEEDAPGLAFALIWNDVHGKGAWDENPECVALSFRVIKANIDAPEARAA